LEGNAVNRGGQTGGGAIGLFGGSLAEIQDSTFVNNRATGLARGGAIINDGGTLDLTNCTFVGNHADSNGGALAAYKGTTTLTQVTVSGNSTAPEGQGSGLYRAAEAALVVRNTVIAANTPANNCGGGLTDQGGNRTWPAEDASCGLPSGDPKLAPLGNYGGPTQTMALQPGSAALEAAHPAYCSQRDQRGRSRPNPAKVSGLCDSGAFEYYRTYHHHLPVVFKQAASF
jgi:hypothetical protein